MNNGDHITGEVKRLQNGYLYVETEYVYGNIALDWNQVQSVESAADIDSPRGGMVRVHPQNLIALSESLHEH